VDEEADVPAEAVAKVVRRMRGLLERQSRDLQMVAAFLAGRDSIRGDDDPFAPEVFMKSLLNAARDLDLEPSGWDALLESLERPMTEELIRGHEALAEHFRRHRIEPVDIRREMAARQALGRPTLEHLDAWNKELDAAGIDGQVSPVLLPRYTKDVTAPATP